MYKGDWLDYCQELKKLFEEIGQDAYESESIFREALKAEGRRQTDNVLIKLADVAKSIDISLVTSSRD